jgi:hypothetical protein
MPKRKIPQFKSEEEEREFWSTHDSTEYVDWSEAKRVTFPSLKRDKVTIPVQVSRSTYENMQKEAKRRGVSLLDLATSSLKDKLAAMFRS